MSKVIVRTPNGASPRQINFANPKAKKDIERSTKGAIHFSSGSTKIITKDELEYIETFHKSFYKTLIVIYTTESTGKPKTISNVVVSVPVTFEDLDEGLDADKKKYKKK